MSTRRRLGWATLFWGALASLQFLSNWIGRATLPEDSAVALQRYGELFERLTAIDWFLPVVTLAFMLLWIFWPAGNANEDGDPVTADVGLFAAFEFMVTGYWHSYIAWGEKDTQAAEDRFLGLARAGRLSVWGKPYKDGHAQLVSAPMEPISSDYWNNATLDTHYLLTRKEGRTSYASPYDMFDSERSHRFYADLRVNRAQIKREFGRSWLRKIRYRLADYRKRKVRDAKVT